MGCLVVLSGVAEKPDSSHDCTLPDERAGTRLGSPSSHKGDGEEGEGGWAGRKEGGSGVGVGWGVACVVLHIVLCPATFCFSH